MADSSWILEGGRKKLGNIVLRKGENGKTVMSKYVVPSNPRTNGQMRTRIAFGTVAKAGAALTDLVGISMQGETTIKGARRKFNSLNIQYLTSALKNNIAEGRYAPKGFSVLIPNKYIVSDGTIRNATLGNVQVVGDALSQTSHQFTLPYNNVVTPAEFIKTLFGCEPGDQITAVAIRSGVQVDSREADLEILRDGQMASARLFFKDAAELSTLPNFSTVDILQEGAAEVGERIADYVNLVIKDGYTPFVNLIANPNGYQVSIGDGENFWTILWDVATASSDSYDSLAGILGGEDVMALGYFRSHLNNAGTQWMFSRCQLVTISPEYTEETFNGDEPINYGYLYNLALLSYVNATVYESTRYTETGGSDNTLGPSLTPFPNRSDNGSGDGSGDGSDDGNGNG